MGYNVACIVHIGVYRGIIRVDWEAFVRHTITDYHYYNDNVKKMQILDGSVEYTCYTKETKKNPFVTLYISSRCVCIKFSFIGYLQHSPGCPWPSIAHKSKIVA